VEGFAFDLDQRLAVEHDVALVDVVHVKSGECASNFTTRSVA
jgi:hypothetical protein